MQEEVLTDSETNSTDCFQSSSKIVVRSQERFTRFDVVERCVPSIVRGDNDDTLYFVN